MRPSVPAALAAAAVVAIVVIAALAARGSRAGFYTGYATEEPTRDYIPYTGTIPYGTWGVKPWAFASEV